MQADPTENTLPEEDARLFVDALLGLRSLVDWREHLLENLLAYEGACMALRSLLSHQWILFLCILGSAASRELKRASCM